MSSIDTNLECVDPPAEFTVMAEEYYRLFLSGHIVDSTKLKRKLIRRIKRELDARPRLPSLWCMLGDLYTHHSKRIEFYKHAIDVCSRHGEGYSELARDYAAIRDPRYGICIDKAVRFCCNDILEEEVLYAALDAARIARDEKRAERVRRIGQRRFPDCSLFD